ncbi:MAG: hypothetical protein Ct9H300mP8_08800 [Gammaproteobacteria bacterium]|nr:MAG: hypothetical protein Ct9H300mP8_08800 [Gammaproteobacteria bacterium]
MYGRLIVPNGQVAEFDLHRQRLDKPYVRESDMHNRHSGYGDNWPNNVIALYPRYIGVDFTYNFAL